MTQILLLIYGVISCAIAKGRALRERGNVRTSGGAASSAGKILPITISGFAQLASARAVGNCAKPVLVAGGIYSTKLQSKH